MGHQRKHTRSHIKTTCNDFHFNLIIYNIKCDALTCSININGNNGLLLFLSIHIHFTRITSCLLFIQFKFSVSCQNIFILMYFCIYICVSVCVVAKKKHIEKIWEAKAIIMYANHHTTIMLIVGRYTIHTYIRDVAIMSIT